MRASQVVRLMNWLWLAREVSSSFFLFGVVTATRKIVIMATKVLTQRNPLQIRMWNKELNFEADKYLWKTHLLIGMKIAQGGYLPVP